MTTINRISQYACNRCGAGFLSAIELRAHRQRYKGPHQRPVQTRGKTENIIQRIEALRESGSHGYHESDAWR